jgi:hypothetical protein
MFEELGKIVLQTLAGATKEIQEQFASNVADAFADAVLKSGTKLDDVAVGLLAPNIDVFSARLKARLAEAAAAAANQPAS